jgi:hypothetical protein
LWPLNWALSHRPFLLVSTYRLPGVGFNEVNGLVNEPMAAAKPLLARCDNAFAPDVPVTDKLRSYGAAKSEIGFVGSPPAGLTREQSG